MAVQLKSSAIKQTKWYEYIIRFAFGGLITMAAGYVAKQYGPIIGGLFLAFPSIFPASLTLVETHKERKAERKGESKAVQKDKGIQAAGNTALGTMLGSSGLVAFALVIWSLSTVLTPVLVLITALVAWTATSIFTWWVYIKLAKMQHED